MTDEALMASLRQVADKDEIRDVLMRFCRGVDRLDEELLRSCYHVDSYDDHGPFKGNGQDFAAYIVRSIAGRAHHTTHSVANVLIEIDRDDQDVARSESYVLAYLRHTDDDGKEWLDFFSGRYVDRFERREGIWRIASRIVVHDWSASAELGAASFPLRMDSFTQGRRDRGDLVYRI
jgi:SnoaL-like domain